MDSASRRYSWHLVAARDFCLFSSNHHMIRCAGSYDSFSRGNRHSVYVSCSKAYEETLFLRHPRRPPLETFSTASELSSNAEKIEEAPDMHVWTSYGYKISEARLLCASSAEMILNQL